MAINFFDKQVVFDYTKLPSHSVYPLNTHQNNVLVVTSLQQAQAIKPRTVEADAIVTNCKDILLVMPSADCAPIVLIDEQMQIIALMHCGWKPAVRGLIKNTLKHMVKLGAKASNIQAIIGPCIGKSSFECHADMQNIFLEESISNSRFFSIRTNNSWDFDLQKYCIHKLNELGIEHTESSNIDTFANSNYHSYRRYCQTSNNGFELSKQNGAFLNLNQASL